MFCGSVISAEDMEKECERVLLSETDINVKRNAFVLIFDLN